jgi:hypothetical protein
MACGIDEGDGIAAGEEQLPSASLPFLYDFSLFHRLW